MTTGRLPSHYCHIALGLLTPHSLKKSWIVSGCKFFVIVFKAIIQKEQQMQDFENWKSCHAEFTWNHFIKSLLKCSFTVIVKFAKIKKRCGRVLSEYNSLLHLQGGPKLRITAISVYSVITLFGLSNQNYCRFFEFNLVYNMWRQAEA